MLVTIGFLHHIYLNGNDWKCNYVCFPIFLMWIPRSSTFINSRPLTKISTRQIPQLLLQPLPYFISLIPSINFYCLLHVLSYFLFPLPKSSVPYRSKILLTTTNHFIFIDIQYICITLLTSTYHFVILDLEGPVYMKPPGESLDWFKSIFSGNHFFKSYYSHVD